MEVIVVVSLITLTSIGGYLVGRSLLGLCSLHLSRAIRHMLECVGMSLAFAVANLLIGAAAILVFRETAGKFVPLYILDDVTLILASIIQGIIFCRWFQLGIRGGPGNEEF